LLCWALTKQRPPHSYILTAMQFLEIYISRLLDS
jgi:hypothetical protein